MTYDMDRNLSAHYKAGASTIIIKMQLHCSLSLVVCAGLSREPFTCIGANCANELLAGGTEKVGDDASVYFWSVRKAIHSSRG